MRLWSLHPRYLDAKGLTACWREGLLARSVLRGDTKGYTHHPQLERFRHTPDPLGSIETYLVAVLEESQRRGYRYDPSKIDPETASAPIPVTQGQLTYELEHLRKKLLLRDPETARKLPDSDPTPHPLFTVIAGNTEPWEKTTPVTR